MGLVNTNPFNGSTQKRRMVARGLLLAIGFACLALSAQAYLLKSEAAPYECVPDAELNAIVGLTSEERLRCKEFCKRYIYIQNTVHIHPSIHPSIHIHTYVCVLQKATALPALL
jgi:hypothetical protein